MNSKILYDRSLHEPSGGYLQKRHSEHLSPSNIPGTRVYPYPGTTQEPVRNSYHHSGSHSSSLSYHLNPLYSIGTNSPHSAAVGPQPYREGNYSVDRHEFSSIDRYRNRNESNEIHHSSGSASAQNAANTGHNQPTLVRRRPSLLPQVPQSDYNLLSSGNLSPYVNRDRYELYRYSPFERGTKASLQANSISLPSTTASGHTGPSNMHMVGQHGLHLSVGHPHQAQAIVTSQHLAQSHIIQDIQDLNVNKRPRLGFGNDSRSSLHQPLLIDTRDVVEVKKEPAYTPQVEAISPTLPNDDVRQDMSPLKSTKDELLQNINKIDREILQTESQISKLRKKHQELEMVTNKSSVDNQELQDTCGLESQLSIAQIIYSENKTKSTQAHSQLDKLGPAIELPLYNQPSDTLIYHENKQNFVDFKKNLIQFFKKRYQEKQVRQRYLTDTYDKLMLSWLKKLEKKETNPAKKTKDSKMREYFEKQFPELRKQREDKERFSRVGQRIRSDAELEEIMDGLQEQELEDKKMRSYAVIPPILLDSRHKKHYYINRNGFIEDPMSEYKERQMLNIWTDQEKDIFKEKYLLHPKNFALIASFLERKSVPECVQYYYLSKKNENYKQLLRKQVKKRTRALVKAQQQQQQQQQAIAAQVQSQQRPPAPGVARPQAVEECLKTTTIASTATVTSNSTLSTTSPMTTVVNTIVTSSSVVSVTNLTISTNDVTPTPEPKVECNVNDSVMKCDNISDNEENNANNEIMSDMSHQCCLCESNLDEFCKSRAVTLNNSNSYNIDTNKFKHGMRVCYDCHFKHVKRNCPLPSCKTPRRKVKRLKSLPQQWLEMNAETRQHFANELNVPTDVKTACPRCVMRISRRIGLMTNSDQPIANQNNKNSWTDLEIDRFKSSLKQVGKDWKTIAVQIGTKTETECRDFYIKHKYSFNLHKVLKQFQIESGKTGRTHDSDSDEYWNDMSDGDSEETSSAEEGNDRCNSDTASASSPISKTIEEMDTSTLKTNVDKTINKMICPPTRNIQEDFNKLQDYKGLSASQNSLKSDYDSSATMSADEGQGLGEGDRMSSSPAVTLPPRANSAMPVFPPSNSIYYQHQSIDKHVRPASHDAAFAIDAALASKVSHMPSVMRSSDPNVLSRQKVPPFLINPNAPSAPQLSNSGPHVANVTKEEPTCVRDLIYQAIEMSLQSPLKPMRPNSQQHIGSESNKSNSNEEINSVPNPYPLSVVKRENIIDLTKGDNNRDSPSHISYKTQDIQKPEGLAVMASYRQHLTPSPSHGPQPYVMIEPDEYEVQDLSKKDRRPDPYNFSPSMKEKMNHRNDYPYGLMPSHHHQSRGSTPVNESSVNLDINALKQLDSNRHMAPGFVVNERIHSQDMRSRDSPSNRAIKLPLSKSSPVPPPPPLINSMKSNQSLCQLSPKMYREKVVPVSAPSGGSITQGTPGIQQPNNYPFGQNRYEGLLRVSSKIPSVIQKEGGSITLGTPLMSGNNLPMDGNRRKIDVPITDPNRRSSSPITHSYSPGFTQAMFKQKPPFHKESQLSSNQIMIDFNTSKQMLTRRGSNNSDKDGRSSTPIGQLESRSSMNEPKNRLTSTSNTYPSQPTVPISSVFHRDIQPQLLGPSESHMNQWTPRHSPIGPNSQSPNYNRQNVIQHWNAATPKQSVIQTPKSNSPREYRQEVVSPVAHSVMRSSASPQIPITSSLYSPSHDAFTTLVNAAAAQQSLAVPNIDRRAGSMTSMTSRSDLTGRANIKEKTSAEGLERSLMEIHSRPLKLADNESKMEDKLKMGVHNVDTKPFHGNRSALTDDYMYVLEHKRRQEMEQMAELERQRYNRSANDHHNALSQPSLRFSREPFSREQFERELRQPTEPVRHLSEHQYRVKTEDPDQTHDSRLISSLRPQTSELDNEASKLFSQSFQKDNQKVNSSRGQFTAANLIDAIITHQINASTDSPNGKAHTPVVSSALGVSESPPTSVNSLFVRYPNNDKLVTPHYHNREEVVTIADSPDPDKSYAASEKPMVGNVSNQSAKNVTLGEHIATIISKNYTNENRAPGALIQIDSRKSPNVYGLSTPLEVRTSNQPVLEGIAATAVSNASSEVNNTLNESPPHSSWKLRKALQQDKETKEPDERQIIRIVQNVSPKPVYPLSVKSISPALSSHYNVEPISPPTRSRENSPNVGPNFSQMQTTWSPAIGIQNVVTSRQLYTADSSEVSNSSKPLLPMTTNNQINQMNVNSNANRVNQPQLGLSPLDYVKNRIVEVMRTTTDEANDDIKRTNNEIHSTQGEKPFQRSDEVKSASNSNEMISSIDSTKKLNAIGVKRDIERSSASSLNSVEVNSHVKQEAEENSETPAKKIKTNTEKESHNERMDISFLSNHESKNMPSEMKSNDSDHKVTQSSVKENKVEDKISERNLNISTSESDMKSGEKSNCEVSSGDDIANNTDAKESHMYVDSPSSGNSPGEMVIDESDHNLSSSLSPIDKTVSESPPTSSCHTQQSLISTSDVHKTEPSNDNKSQIASSSESAVEVLDQSQSVSSSVVEPDKTPTPVTDTSATNELNPNYCKQKSLNNQSDSSLNLANSVSSSASTVPSTLSNVQSTQEEDRSANTSGVTSSIGMSCESSGKSGGNVNIQSCAVSGSGTPTSTTRNTSNTSTPQYEPLSDDE